MFPVKYSKALLEEEVVEIIKETAIGIQERYAIEFEVGGMDRDHIHILCSAHPKVAPGGIVRIFKSITAREVFRRKPTIKKELWGGVFWADRYYVATVGEKANWRTVERYIERQGKSREDLRQLKLFN